MCPFNPYVPDQQEAFISFVKNEVVPEISEDVRLRLTRELSIGCGLVFVTGLPVDRDLPPTPVRGGPLAAEYKTSFVAEGLLLALGCVTGAEPYTFRQEGRGTAPILDNVVPIPELRGQKGAGGYENNFPFHCESSWHRKRPDYLGLIGVRGADDARTVAFSSRTLSTSDWPLDSLDIEGWFRLRAPDLYLQMESSGVPLGTDRYSYVSPIRESAGDVLLNINFNGTECIHAEAVSWLDRLETLIEECAYGVVLSAGTALLLNNTLSCHTRTGYSPQFTGEQRWFLRANFSRTLLEPAVWEATAAHRPDWRQADRLKLERLGWMDSRGTLTASFLPFVTNPLSISSLSEEDARLAAIACHFTPVHGSRIV
jgi:hypothetical protein